MSCMLKVYCWCLSTQTFYSPLKILSAGWQSCSFGSLVFFDSLKNKQKQRWSWASENVFSPFEALQHRKCQAVLEGCLLVSCFCIYWCISLAKTNRMPKDMLNFHLEPEARQVKKSLFSGDLKRSPEQFQTGL